MRNFVVTIDGKSYSVGVEEVDAAASVAPVTVAEPKPAQKSEAPAAPVAVATPAASAAPIADGAGEKLLSPFPGLIKNVLVKDGDTVKKNQPVIVLEAMKMDNDITSPCDGKISVRVSKGANVETNTLLAVIG